MQTLLTEWELERASYEGKVLAQAEGTQSAEFWIARRIAQVQDAKTKEIIDRELRIISGRIRAGGDAVRLIGDLRRELEWGR